MLKFNGLFKKTKYITVSTESLKNEEVKKPSIPDGMWTKCDKCGKILYKKDLEKNLKVCYYCGHHLRLNAKERIDLVIDDNTFIEYDKDLIGKDPLKFKGYNEKINQNREKSSLNEAVVTGEGKINGTSTVIAVMDSNFMMGSMGTAVGEKIARAVETATEKKLPIIIFTASGGARMQEGIFSLMQMAKISATLKKHDEEGLPYIVVLTDPTTGGVTASFAMQGDIILAEPGALVGFAGKRVIEQTINEKLPDNFQSAEFLLEHGFIDKIVNREELKIQLSHLLKLHKNEFEEFKKEDIFVRMRKKDKKLTPWEKIEIARDKDRPTALKYMENIFNGFIELHGDRTFSDDASIIGGIAYLNSMPVTVIGVQKGNDLKENIKRNFGMPHPEGYRKALRLMKQAEKFNRPIICLVDTPGAFCGVGAEQRCQGEAIAQNLITMFGLKVPIISIIIGEGGSGGALALAVADEVWMLENSVYSILSPEGFASILWKDSKRAKEAAEVMKVTAEDLKNFGVIEKVIKEPVGGAQKDLLSTSKLIKKELLESLRKLIKKDTENLLQERYDKFRNIH